jgi:uncharacterized protein (TIGR03084 family)
MLQVSVDLRDEADELHAFLKTLSNEDWGKPSPFLGWTPWDVVAHLHFYDRVSLLSLTDTDAFNAKFQELIEAMGSGLGNAEIARREFGRLDPAELLERWHQSCHEMAEKLGASDPKRRLMWFGPPMGVQMFTTARYMETWAHGQDVYDLMRAPRAHTDRIENIAVLGVKTYGWTFANRGLDVPGPPPYVRLTAPSGAIWEWNDSSEADKIEGFGVDFCRVVTQGRNVADTQLEVVGDAAAKWMAIAQCFAGAPTDPPKPGERTWPGESGQQEE